MRNSFPDWKVQQIVVRIFSRVYRYRNRVGKRDTFEHSWSRTYRKSRNKIIYRLGIYRKTKETKYRYHWQPVITYQRHKAKRLFDPVSIWQRTEFYHLERMNNAIKGKLIPDRLWRFVAKIQCSKLSKFIKTEKTRRLSWGSVIAKYRKRGLEQRPTRTVWQLAVAAQAYKLGSICSKSGWDYRLQENRKKLGRSAKKLESILKR